MKWLAEMFREADRISMVGKATMSFGHGRQHMNKRAVSIKKCLLWCFLALAVVLVTYGSVFWPADGLADQAGGDWLVISVAAYPAGFNPCTTSGAPGGTVYGLCNDTLARRSPKNPDEWEPRLAESWDVSDDGKTIVFRLREGVRWHDGTALTAKDILFTWKTYTDPDLRLYQRPIYRNCSVEIADDNSVRFVWSSTDHENFTYSADMDILPAHIMAYSDAREFFRKAQNPMIPGNGPWKMNRSIWYSVRYRLVTDQQRDTQ